MIEDPLEALRGFPSEATEETDRSGDATLDQDAFLKIFLAQLANQDPLEPEDPSELSSQLAVYSQLEQQISMAEELRGVNTRLDSLIEKDSGSPLPDSDLDPVSLIGRVVEVGSSELVAPTANASSAELGFELLGDSTYWLRLQGASADGTQSLGIATIGSAEQPLAAGSYALVMRGSETRLVHPDGRQEVVTFEPFIEEEGGRIVTLPADHPDAGAIHSPAAGNAYEFAVRRVANDDERTSTPVPTRVSGTVGGVVFEDGRPVLRIGDLRLDPSQILTVR